MGQTNLLNIGIILHNVYITLIITFYPDFVNMIFFIFQWKSIKKFNSEHFLIIIKIIVYKSKQIWYNKTKVP